MAHYKTHFLHTSEDGFTMKQPYMDIHLFYALHSVIGQLRTSSHQLQIEVGRYTQIPLEERLCQLCHQGVILFYHSDLLFSKTRQHLRCNLLFGLIGHFGLLKDVNISFFLSTLSFSGDTLAQHGIDYISISSIYLSILPESMVPERCMRIARYLIEEGFS